MHLTMNLLIMFAILLACSNANISRVRKTEEEPERKIQEKLEDTVYDDVASDCDVPGYYWRNYKGDIPADALEGGADFHYRPIYMGQVYNLKYVIPAKIYTGDKKAYYAHGGIEFATRANVKILCTEYPEYFEWVPTTISTINYITDKHLVIGGYQPGFTTYIGRASWENQLLVGKVMADSNKSNEAGLHVTNRGSTRIFTTFEVLAINSTLLQNVY